jgi:hypothetical protein
MIISTRICLLSMPAIKYSIVHSRCLPSSAPLSPRQTPKMPNARQMVHVSSSATYIRSIAACGPPWPSLRLY